MLKNFFAIFALAVVAILAAPAARAGDGPYNVIKKIAVGGEGGWDYLTVDAPAHRLYVSRSSHVMAIDLTTDSIAGDIPNTNGVHGIAIAPEAGKGYISCGRDSSVTVFDLKSLKTLKSVPTTGANPDAIAYDPFTQRVFTFNGRGHNITAIDTKTDEVVGTIPLDGKPEFAASDAKGTMFVNLEDKSQIVAFDPKDLKVKATWPIAPGEEPSGLSIDREHGRLFSGCSNDTLIVLDCATGKVVAVEKIGSGVDATAFDPGSQNAFSSNGRDSSLTVIHEDSPDKFSIVQNVVTQAGARTCAVDAGTGHIFVVTASFGPPPAPSAEGRRQRPPMIPGSFVVLEIGK